MSAGTTNTATTTATSDHAELAGSVARRSRRRWVIGAVVLVLIVVGAVEASGVLGGGGNSNTPTDGGSATSLWKVKRMTLSERIQLNGTLGYTGSYTVLGQSSGLVTKLPTVGQVIHQGHVLYRVDQSPVVLLYGSVPAYRDLALGATTAARTGADVAQLNHDLVALGYVDKAYVDSGWDQFNWATRLGVEKLQDHLGVEQTGKLSLGDVVFLPTAARVTSMQASLGAPATGPILQASSTTPTITVPLQADLQSEIKAGNRVTITLPDGRTTPGRVASVGTVATVASGDQGGQGSSTPTVPVHIRPTRPAAIGSLDQAPVTVTITQHKVHNVLAVNVTALLARTGGGYAVEVVNGDGTHHLVKVTPGLFDDVAGLVQVSGSGLSAGQRVVVPGNE
jgi:hypothetical protein